jgi:carbon-monoxide dehydrogenase medium subunit
MDDQIEIGALITHSEVMNSIILKKFAECLIEACSQVGTWQIRNLGTIGGNLVNASPAADTAPCFLVLGAKVRLRSINNVREIKIEDFFTGVKKSVIRPDEILVSVIFPRHARSTSAWARIGRRNANTLSIASVASLVSIKDGIFEEAKIAMGAVAPTPILARNASNFLKNKEVNRKNIIEAAEMAAEEAKPITDVRASAWYRREMIKVLAQKTLLSAISRSGVSLDG